MTDKERAYGREYRAKHRERLKQQALDRHYRVKFGITLEQYNELLLKQNQVCALCLHRPQIRLAVDHNHKTGKIRGLLCTTCNRVVVAMVDRHDWYLKSLTEYVNENRN